MTEDNEINGTTCIKRFDRKVIRNEKIFDYKDFNGKRKSEKGKWNCEKSLQKSFSLKVRVY